MNLFISYSWKDLKFISDLVSFLRAEGHDVFDPMDLEPGEDWMSSISASIRSADVLLAVVTTNNPDIFFELGLAFGASVPILVAAPIGEMLPANVASVPYVQLTGDVSRDAQTIMRRINYLTVTAPPIKLTRLESAEASLREAANDPAVLESLQPVEFEKLVMELFIDRGYAVRTTDSTRDFGVDFGIDFQKGDDLVPVEVKKLSRQSRVSVEAVRQLLSAVSVLGASAGLFVTTTGFTSAALALASGTPIVLRTLEEILAMNSEEELLEKGTIWQRNKDTIIDENRDN